MTQLPLAVLGHEIRTPMNALNGVLELLALDPRGDDQRTLIATALESADAVLRIVNDMVDYSQLEAGRMEIVQRPFRVADALASVRRMFRDAAGRRGLSLEYRLSARCPAAAVSDEMRIKQVLGNFVSNAIKFTGSGGVTMGASPGNGRLRLWVCDTGPGIAPEVRKRLFEPFVQGGVDLAHRSGGNGLGLAICRRLASLLGGRIRLRSQPGRGTLAILSIPLVACDASPASDAEDTGAFTAIAAAGGAAGARILVCDDNELNRRVVAYQLRTLGYDVDTAADGVAALARWKAGEYAAVLLDCRMPGLSGFEVAQQMRHLEAAFSDERGSVILACTADVSERTRRLCLAAGIDGVLHKPVRLRTLQASLDHALRKRGERPVAPAQSAAPAPCGARAIHRANLAEIVGSDLDFQAEVLAEFVAQKRGEVVALLAAAAEPVDRVAIGRAAHRLRGAALIVAAHDLSAACRELEEAARGGETGAVAGKCAQVEREFQRVCDEVAGSVRERGPE